MDVRNIRKYEKKSGRCGEVAVSGSSTVIVSWNQLPDLQCRSDNVLRSVSSPVTAIRMKTVLRSIGD